MDHKEQHGVYSSTETQGHYQGHRSPWWTPAPKDIATIKADPMATEVLRVLAQDRSPKSGPGGALGDYALKCKQMVPNGIQEPLQWPSLLPN